MGAIEDFINQGYDAIIINAVSTEGFDRVIRLADRNGVVVPFDNVLDTNKVMEVNENQYEMGVLSAKWLLKEIGKKEGTILEVRGLPGNSVDRDRHEGFQATMKAAAASGTSSRSSATGTTARPRRPPPTRWRCTATSTGCSPRAAPPARCGR